MTDEDRLAACLARLWPHLDGEALALTGGVAIGVHLPSRRRLADVDFVAARMDAVRPSVTREYLVSHYHVPGPGVKKAIVQLVDPATRLRIDVFPDHAGAVARATKNVVAGGPRLVVGAADLLAHKRALLARAREGGTVDDKHWEDACALAALCGEPAPPAPASMARDVYSTDLGYVCDRCARSASPAFPLADKREIFAILGYV